MKILNVSALLDPVAGGGTAERTFQLSRYLAMEGVDTTILTIDLGLTPERISMARNIKIVALPCLFKRFYYPKFSYKEIEQIVYDADIIHLIGHWTILNILIYFISYRLGKPYVVCPAGALPIYGRSRFLKKIYNIVVGKRIIKNAARKIAISRNEIDHFVKYGVSANSVTVIPNGVDPQDFVSSDSDNFRRQYNIKSTKIILFVGRLNHIKGPDMLLRAFCNIRNEFPGYALVFVGPDDGMLNELQTTVDEYNAGEYVRFIGYLGGAEKSQAYHSATLLVIPSRQEAMSIVVLEAGISGIPVLLTDACGFDQINDIDGGHVVQASVTGIQSGLREMLNDPQGLERMGVMLKKFIADKLTWAAIAKKYLVLYDDVSSSR